MVREREGFIYHTYARYYCPQKFFLQRERKEDKNSERKSSVKIR
jgi:hypothetical protein